MMHKVSVIRDLNAARGGGAAKRLFPEPPDRVRPLRGPREAFAGERTPERKEKLLLVR